MARDYEPLARTLGVGVGQAAAAMAVIRVLERMSNPTAPRLSEREVIRAAKGYEMANMDALVKFIAGWYRGFISRTEKRLKRQHNMSDPYVPVSPSGVSAGLYVASLERGDIALQDILQGSYTKQIAATLRNLSYTHRAEAGVHRTDAFRLLTAKTIAESFDRNRHPIRAKSSKAPKPAKTVDHLVLARDVYLDGSKAWGDIIFIPHEEG